MSNNITYILEPFTLQERMEYKSLPIDGWIHPCIYCECYTARNILFIKQTINYICFLCYECNTSKNKDNIEKNYLNLIKEYTIKYKL